MMFQDEFVRFYGWGIIVKYHMALYTVGLVSAAGAVRWLMGHRELPIPMLVEMLLVSAAVAALESWILPFDREWEGGRCSGVPFYGPWSATWDLPGGAPCWAGSPGCPCGGAFC